MTKMLIDLAVVEKALEAMKKATRFMSDSDYKKLNEAIEDLDAVLAEPEPHNQCGETCERAKLCAVCARGLAEQVQEPVAFITPLMEQQMFDDWCPYKGSPDPRTVWAAAVDSVNGLLLGASPPQRKPLTEEEIGIICASLGFAQISPVEVARAIERAHGIE